MKKKKQRKRKKNACCRGVARTEKFWCQKKEREREASGWDEKQKRAKGD